MNKFGSNMNPFWSDVFSAYDEFKHELVVEASDVWQIPIFLSSKIVIGRKPFWKRKLFDAGCRSINDIYNSQGELMSFEEFRRTYPGCLNALTFETLRCLVQRISIPSEFGGKKPIGPFIHPALLQILNADCRQYYDALLNVRYKKTDSPLPSQIKWNSILSSNIFWGHIYYRYKRCSKNTTLIWFQDRIVHRILTTNTFASKFMDVSDLCTFCGRERETIQHLMVACEEVGAMWQSVKDMIRDRLKITLELNPQEIILGFDPALYECPRETATAIQRLILIGKWYIYSCKVRKEKPRFVNLLQKMKILTQAEFMYDHDKNEREIRVRDINMVLCCNQTC
ncbi:uncharacterized protein LOC122377201 [Amphibalanus amphitrite]|uniref:uncharacterized protein LOC122377201 n=1 Tax=Amphibalanus amphitrite TaxID=1232801 RepID=UPI001C91DA75|nr:uncharacterized protein LOC122377201 [Amphibalanus amphitrite]